jgi:hypothetical protein
MISQLTDNAKKIVTTDSDILKILESNSITETLKIKSAFLVFSREGTFYRLLVYNSIPLNIVYEIQDKIYNKYKIDMEIIID